MRGVQEGDRVTVKTDDSRPEMVGREGIVKIAGRSLVLVEFSDGEQVYSVDQLLRSLDIAREFGSDVAGELADTRAAVAKMNAAVDAALVRARSTPAIALELLEELVPDLLELVGLSSVLPAQAVPIVETIARKLAEKGRGG